MANDTPYGAEIPDAELFVKRELTVKLHAAGNIDRGEDPHAPVHGVPNGRKAVGSLAEAAMACRAYIDGRGLGAGQWTGGDVSDKAGAPVAKVSYNGRVWSAPARASATKAKKRSLGPTM